MPELPEVEAVVRTVRPLVTGRRIRSVHVLHAIAVKPQRPSGLARLAGGQKIQGLGRRGKYLIVELERGILTMHFRLDGHLLWFSNVQELLERANTGREKVHVDVALELDKGVLGFADGTLGECTGGRRPKTRKGWRHWAPMLCPKSFPWRI